MVKLELDSYLKAEDVTENGINVTFHNEGEYKTISTNDGDKRIFEISVVLDSGDIVQWSPNNTSLRAVSSVYGKETKDWVGRSVTLYKIKQNVKGVIKEVIYAKVPNVDEEVVQS